MSTIVEEERVVRLAIHVFDIGVRMLFGPNRIIPPFQKAVVFIIRRALRGLQLESEVGEYPFFFVLNVLELIPTQVARELDPLVCLGGMLRVVLRRGRHVGGQQAQPLLVRGALLGELLNAEASDDGDVRDARAQGLVPAWAARHGIHHPPPVRRRARSRGTGAVLVGWQARQERQRLLVTAVALRPVLEDLVAHIDRVHAPHAHAALEVEVEGRAGRMLRGAVRSGQAFEVVLVEAHPLGLAVGGFHDGENLVILAHLPELPAALLDGLFAMDGIDGVLVE
mmetsp:Transcript_80619/g.246372  ORF Transcript_80619/g.246372 Transcript_80619/m.246372 type:complete len:282 (-) Transcript_80619:1967-2812(-)